MSTNFKRETNYAWWLTGMAILGLYALGIAFPEPLWGVHSPGLLPGGTTIGLFGIAAVLFSSVFWLPEDWIARMDRVALPQPRRRLLYAGLAVLAAGVFAQFPIFKDYYGDALFINGDVDLTIPQWDSRLLTDPLRPDFLDSKVGLNTYFEVNNIFTWLTGANGTEVARVIGCVLGGVFAFLWMLLVDAFVRRPLMKVLLIAAGLTAPLVQVYMGHYETYAYSYTAMLAWMSVLGLYFKTENRRWYTWLVLLFPIVLQTHITNWLLFPALVLTTGWHFRHRLEGGWLERLDAGIRKRFSRFRGGFTWPGILLYCMVPAALLGLVAYVFVTGNFDGPREFSGENFEDSLFLPLYTDEGPPYDRYNLLSGAHLLDFFNLLLLWSGAVLCLLLPVLTFLRKSVPWNKPLLLITGSSSLLFLAAFFMLNPILSLSIDWDLFITPALLVLPLLVFVYAEIEEKVPMKMVAGPVLGLCVLGASFMMVNTSQEALSERLGLLGRWNFKHYWLGSSTELLGSAKLAGEGQEAARLAILEDLRPYAVAGVDKEFAGMLMAQGRFELEKAAGRAAALRYFEEAFTFDPLLGDNLYHLTAEHYRAGNFKQAYTYGSELAKLRYPPYQRTLDIAVMVALAAGEYQAAANYAVTYLNRWQDNPRIAEVERRLRTGERIATLIDLYRNNPPIASE